jgi:hypothetical protein
MKRRRCLLLASLLLTGLAAAPPTGRAADKKGLSKDRYLAAMDRALDQLGKTARGAAARGGRVQIHANLFLAHEAFIASTPLDTLKRAVDAFKEAGIAQVDLNMGLFPWVDGDQPTIAKYDAVVEHIRRSGMRVAVNPQYSPLRHKVKGFDEWRRLALQIYGEIARRYQPDVFVVVHEPTTMASRMGARTSPSQWSEFAREAAKLVREKSKNSRIGAGGLSTEKKYFDAFAGMREIDVLTLDVYQLRPLPTYEEMVRTAKANGKPVYVEETWRPPYYQPAPGRTLDQVSVQSVGDPAFEALDVKWMQTMAAWAAAQGIEGITPVWMQTFFAYGSAGTEAFDREYLRRVMAAIDKGERTRTFHALKDLAR